jgi:hypothetical protein
MDFASTFMGSEMWLLSFFDSGAVISSYYSPSVSICERIRVLKKLNIYDQVIYVEGCRKRRS